VFYRFNRSRALHQQVSSYENSLSDLIKFENYQRSLQLSNTSAVSLSHNQGNNINKLVVRNLKRRMRAHTIAQNNASLHKRV